MHEMIENETLETRVARLPLGGQPRGWRVALWALICLIAFASPPLHADQPDGPPLLSVDQLVVLLIDQSEVPATQAGPIAELLVREGATVRRGQVLAKIADQRARLRRDHAAKEVAIDKANAKDHLRLQLAKKTLDQRRQESRQHARQLKIVQKTAGNRLRVDAVTKSAAVAQNELQRARAAHAKYADSVSESEIESLTLSAERADLETLQAEFEFELAKLEAEVTRTRTSQLRFGDRKGGSRSCCGQTRDGSVGNQSCRDQQTTGTDRARVGST